MLNILKQFTRKTGILSKIAVEKTRKIASNGEQTCIINHENSGLSDGCYSLDLLKLADKVAIKSETGLDDYPKVIIDTSLSAYDIDLMVFISNMQRVAISASTDQSRINICSVYLDQDQIVTTNGHVLSLVTNGTYLKDVIIPIDFVNKLIACKAELKKYDRYYTIGLSEDKKHLILRNDQITFTCRLVESQYPDYKQVLLKPELITGTIILSNTKQLCKELVKIKPVKPSNSYLKTHISHYIAITKETIDIIHADNGKLRYTLSKHHPVNIDEPIYLNAYYFIQALKYINDCVINLMDNLNPIEIIEHDYKIVIMPVRFE